MNTDVIRRFLTALSSAVKIERGQLYQLVQSAETSYYLRDIESQHELGLLLQSFGYPFSQVGKYYESIYLHRIGQHQKARQLLECVAESAPAHYRSKALLSLSAVAAHIGHFEESLRLRLQLSSSVGVDPITLIEAQRGIAILRSLEGDRRGALRDLERLMPLAHIIGQRGHPAYFDFLNSYATELSDSNRTDEAEQVAKIVAASPLIGSHPEWRETISEIEAKRKRSSFVAVTHPLDRTVRDSRIRTLVDFMTQNVQRRITLTGLSKMINISNSHISNLFKQHVGLSPIEFLIRLRIRKAQELLATNSHSIKEVMALVGYNATNRRGFLNQFKRLTNNLTPTEYKRRARRR